MMLKRKTTPVKNNTKNSSAPSLTYITKNTDITADLQCDDDVRIAGTLKGQIQSKQKMILNETGKINGTIRSPKVDISGKVNGDIYASDQLILRSSAFVDGKIYTTKLIVEEGAQLKGQFQVGPDFNTGQKESEKGSLLKKQTESETKDVTTKA